MVFIFLTMLVPEFIQHLETLLSQKIKNFVSVSGGDISIAYKLQTESDSFFLKVNKSSYAKQMFSMEALGLSTIAELGPLKTPKVFATGTFGINAFLVLEWIDTKTPSIQDMKLFGTQLAELHAQTDDQFGFQQDNYIGSLPQSNKRHDNWLDFYIEERLLPQFELAHHQNYLVTNEVPSSTHMKDCCSKFFEGIKPALLHGDLWNGNYSISEKGVPYLIDPAIYYGHHEIDIAMTKLFGGFGESFYGSYHKKLATDEFTLNRIELYQLYYLLVHLNLFGRSYYSSVKHIVSKYF